MNGEVSRGYGCKLGRYEWRIGLCGWLRVGVDQTVLCVAVMMLGMRGVMGMKVVDDLRSASACGSSC